MRPVLFHLGSFPVHSFAVMMVLGFLVAGLVMRRELGRKGVPVELAWSVVLFGAAGGILGSRIAEAAHAWDELVADPIGSLAGFEGMVWYGGLAGGILATLWPIYRAGQPWATVADAAAPGLAVGQAFGRLGCHLAGDGDWGTPTALPWAVAYPAGTSPWPHPAGVRVHPAPIYEALALLAILALLLAVRATARRPGWRIAAYLALAGGVRFLVEFVRTNEPVLFGLTEAQWVGLALLVGAGAWLASTHVRSPSEEAGRGG